MYLHMYVCIIICYILYFICLNWLFFCCCCFEWPFYHTLCYTIACVHNRISLHQTIKHNNAIILWKLLVYNEERKKSVTHRDVQKAHSFAALSYFNRRQYQFSVGVCIFSFIYIYSQAYAHTHTNWCNNQFMNHFFYFNIISTEWVKHPPNRTENSSIWYWYGCYRYYYFLCHWCCCCCCCFWLLHVMCVCVSEYIFSWWYKLDITINAYVRSRTQLNKFLSTKVDR